MRLFAYGSLSVVSVFYLIGVGLSQPETGTLLTLTLSGDAHAKVRPVVPLHRNRELDSFLDRTFQESRAERHAVALARKSQSASQASVISGRRAARSAYRG